MQGTCMKLWPTGVKSQYLCEFPLLAAGPYSDYLSGISCGAPPHVIPIPPPLVERKSPHRTSLYTPSSVVPTPSYSPVTGISSGAPPHFTPIPPPLDERKIHHTPSRYTAWSVFPSPS